MEDIFSENWVGPVEGGILLTDILFNELHLIQRQQTRMEYCLQLVECQFSDPWLTCINQWVDLKNKWPFLDLLGKQLRDSNLIRCLLSLMESGIQFTCYVKSTIAMMAKLTDSKAENNLTKELINIVTSLNLENSNWYFHILEKKGYTVPKEEKGNKILVPPITDYENIPARKQFFTTLQRIKLKEKPIYFQQIKQYTKDKDEILKWLHSFEYIAEPVLIELRNIRSKNADFNACLDYFFQTINFRYKFKDKERYEEWLKSQLRDARPNESLSQQLINELNEIEKEVGKEMEIENIPNEIQEEKVENELFTPEELKEEKEKNWIYPKQILNQIRLANKMMKPKEFMQAKINEKGKKEVLQNLLNPNC